MKVTCLQIAEAAGLSPGRKTAKEHLFTCRQHDDHNPTLSINPEKDVFNCPACSAGGNWWTFAAFVAGVSPDDTSAVSRWLHDHGLSDRNGSNPALNPVQYIASYPYLDEEGRLLFEVVRLSPKGFRQRRPDGQCGRIWNMHGVRRVLFRLPEVRKAATVYIVEGEKDVINMEGIGVTATTNPQGAGKWTEEFTRQLQPHQNVVIIPDNDGPGRKHALTIAAAIQRKVASVKILPLPGLPEKGDATDWLLGKEPATAAEELSILAEACKEWKPEHDENPSYDSRVMRFTLLGDLLNEPEEVVQWIAEGLLPASGDSLLVAKPKAGKSTLARCLAMKVSRGEKFLGFSTAQGPVFYLALEEKRSEVRAHFRAMGAKDDPIHIFCAQSPADGLAQLRTAMNSTKPLLVIVDPLFRFVRVKDGNDYAAVTTALEPLHVLARETGAHVLAVHHMGKGDRQGGDAVLGSTALFAAVDTLLIMKRGDKYRTLSSLQRYGTDLEEITLAYDDETRTLSAGLPRAEADQTEAAAAIIEFLSSQSEAVEEGLIHESVDGRKSVNVKALRQGVKDGQIIRTGAGKKGDVYRYSVSCSLVPTYRGEPAKQESENPASRSPECADAGSQLFAGTEPVSKVREQANSATEQEVVTGFGNYAALAKTSRKEVL